MSVASLLSISIEIRQQIYHNILLQDSPGLQILRVCWQIYKEAKHVIFKRPLAFLTYKAVIDWYAVVGPDNLHHVTYLTLRLDPSHIPSVQSARTSEEEESLTRESELVQMTEIIGCMSNLRNLHLLRPSVPRAQRNDERFEHQLLRRLSTRITKLENISWHIDSHSLSPLVAFKGLRRLGFPGFTSDSYEQLAKIAGSLPNLEAIDILPAAFDTTLESRIKQKKGGRSIEPVQPELLAQLPSIRSMSFEESAIWSENPFTFFEPRMIDMLRDSHANTLRSLAIRLDFTPPTNALESTQKLVMNSNIQELRLGWPQMNSTVLKTILPTSLVSLSIWAEFSTQALSLSRTILEDKPHMPNLSKFSLYIKNSAEETWTPPPPTNKVEHTLSLPTRLIIQPSEKTIEQIKTVLQSMIIAGVDTCLTIND